MTTIVIPISRSFLLDKLFARLEMLTCDREQTNILALVDGEKGLYKKTLKLVNASKFKDKQCIKVPDLGVRSSNMAYRRKRIATMHNLAKNYLKPDKYILLLEDDGLFPTNGLAKLLTHYSLNPTAGVIEGLELGRWQSRYIGAWIVDDPYEPSDMHSIEYQPGKFCEIDAGGLYFCLTKYENYINHHFQVYEGNNFGPDIDWTLNLRRQGHQNYIDQSIIIEHYTENGKMFSPKNETPRVISLKRRPNKVWGFYHRVLK